MKTILVVGAAVLKDGRCLVCRRGPAMSVAGRWELPGGKIEEGESAEEALVREIAEELGIEIEVGRHLGHGEATIDGRRIRLDAYLAVWRSGPLELREHDRYLWCTASDLDVLAWAPADVPLIPLLKDALR